MMEFVRSNQRGAADHGWLQSKHTFSFADYHNPQMMGFSELRVINEDWIAAGQGFGTHPHRDMEIITYLIDGELEHKDSMGNGSVIRRGELQRMTAGTGVLHSEFNASDQDPAHLLQIWIHPEKNGLEPGYEQKFFDDADKRNQWLVVGSRDGRDGSLTIHQDVTLSSAIVEAGTSLDYGFDEERHGFLHIVEGEIEIDGETLGTGDAVAVKDIETLSVMAVEQAELLLFDLP